jgi:hypothetical protein
LIEKTIEATTARLAVQASIVRSMLRVGKTLPDWLPLDLLVETLVAVRHGCR